MGAGIPVTGGEQPQGRVRASRSLKGSLKCEQVSVGISARKVWCANQLRILERYPCPGRSVLICCFWPAGLESRDRPLPAQLLSAPTPHFCFGIIPIAF